MNEAIKKLEIIYAVADCDEEKEPDEPLGGFMLIKELSKQVLALLRKPCDDWIPVSENGRLPKEKGYIEVANAKLKIPQTWYWDNTNGMADRLKTFMTHWKPIVLPKPKCEACGGSREDKLIELAGGKYAIIDEEDYDKVNKHKWRVDEAGRVTCNMCIDGKQRNVKMSRFIMNTTRGMFADHINYNLLDNRKSNLRNCTPSQSAAHRRSIPNTSSQYKGVSWCVARNKWEVCIKQNYKGKYLGRYNNEIEAAKAYDDEAKKLFGEYAELNFPTACQPKEPKTGELLMRAACSKCDKIFYTVNDKVRLCPECEPDAGDLVKELRRYSHNKYYIPKCDYYKEITLSEVFNKAADRIVQLKAQNKAIKKRAESAESDWQKAEAEIERLKEDKEGNQMLECWLVHPIDDEDCLDCPSVKDCREVRGLVEQIQQQIAELKAELEAKDGD